VKPFADLIERQLAFFREDCSELIVRCDAAERAYDRADRSEAEERYSTYLELVEEGTEALEEIRDTYARTLEPEQAETYEQAFSREVERHLPRFGLGL
jgi:hypothetical protein